MIKRLFASALVVMAVACSDDDNDDLKSGNTPPAQTEPTLSSSFQSVCARCHGAEGRGQGTYPSIPGTRDEASFIAIVRSGGSEMPASTAAQISDADLKADYLWLTTKRK
jgi:mono/diheme cytochrome c family protein